MTDIYDVTIVGGGFAGMMAAYHLAHAARPPSRIVLIEPGTPGRGVAYSTTNTRHLLNVRAKGMSALPETPSHFLDWLNGEDGQAAAANLGLKTVWDGDDFAPRALYARYLDALWAAARARAEEKSITLHHVAAAAARLERAADGYHIATEGRGRLRAAEAILALGNLPRPAASLPGLIDQVWAAPLSGVAGLAGPVAIIGTGLTMIDMVMSLRDAGYRGRIMAASRNGLFPAVHEAPQPPYASRAGELSAAPRRLSQLMQALRAETRGHPWQAVFDQWRPHLVPLWQQLPDADRKRFLARHFTRWNIRRHRMAPEVARVIEDEKKAGLLDILPGAARAVRLREDGIALETATGRHPADLILDCRGPGYDVTRSDAPLLRQALAEGLLRPHAAGWGIALDDDFGVPGQPGLYAIGTLAIGARLETTAVPELRQQSADVARRIAG
jgi:uncharacterized NAD(P)/FAD-binding protein YdhS